MRTPILSLFNEAVGMSGRYGQTGKEKLHKLLQRHGWHMADKVGMTNVYKHPDHPGHEIHHNKLNDNTQHIVSHASDIEHHLDAFDKAHEHANESIRMKVKVAR